MRRRPPHPEGTSICKASPLPYLARAMHGDSPYAEDFITALVGQAEGDLKRLTT